MKHEAAICERARRTPSGGLVVSLDLHAVMPRLDALFFWPPVKKRGRLRRRAAIAYEPTRLSSWSEGASVDSCLPLQASAFRALQAVCCFNFRPCSNSDHERNLRMDYTPKRRLVARSANVQHAGRRSPATAEPGRARARDEGRAAGCIVLFRGARAPCGCASQVNCARSAPRGAFDCEHAGVVR